jgi:molybdopterin-dependent oxidoreductase alpha subunit
LAPPSFAFCGRRGALTKQEHDGGINVQIKNPKRSATGLPAIASSVARSLRELGPVDAARTLSVINQTEGFDCPGCAWPERKDRHVVEFCESGAKAVADEADHSRCTPAFFAKHSIEELATQDDYWLGQRGRLTHPMIRRSGATHYEPVGWHEAFTLVASELRTLNSPNEAIFYTSGRTSNEAAFAYQLMARAFGTNNLPDCSNMCHEPTSVALQQAIGIGKGSVTFEDFDQTDLVIVVGQNPGTNHPRMLTTLEEVKRRGANIIAVNPLPEAGLIRFKNPQRLRGLVGHGTKLADLHLPVRLGGDQALFRWLARMVLEEDKVDKAFVETYTEGFEAVCDALMQDRNDLSADIGVPATQLDEAWSLVRSAKRIIVCWAMGITQHRDAVATIRDMVNFMLLTGNIGRPGAGLSPIRGHSNVQGDRTMGVWDKPSPEFLDAIQQRFGFDPPRSNGFDAVASLEAMRDGKASVVVSLGGNLARSLPDSALAERALRSCRLTVHISTKLNRTHLVPGEVSLILPTLGRTERDAQAGSPQFVTVEDSFGTVHRSVGKLNPPSQEVRSEVAIVAGIASRLVPDCGVPWKAYADDYRAIRADVAVIVPGFERFEERVLEPGGFLLPHPPRDRREFPTPSGKAQFAVEQLHTPYGQTGELVLQTLRSHDQFNTTIYGLDDRYRGVSGGRRVVFVNPIDLCRLGLKDGGLVDIAAGERIASGFRLVSYDTPPGCIAAYYPEANVLVALDDRSSESGTPSFKSILVTLHAIR